MEEFTYESFSDWEALEQQSGDEAPEVAVSRPLSFVLVEDEQPTQRRHHALSSEAQKRTKRKFSSRRTEHFKKRRTHHPTPKRDLGRVRKSPAADKPLLSQTMPAHNAELDVSAPVYDQNDRIPRHNRRHSSPLRSTTAADLSLETEHVLAAKAIAHSVSGGNNPQCPSSSGSRAWASVPGGALGMAESSAPKHRRTDVDASEEHLARFASVTGPISRGSRMPQDNIALKLTKIPEANEDSEVLVKTHISPTTRPDPVAAHPRRNQQRRHSTPASGAQHEPESVAKGTTNHQTHSAMMGQKAVPGNTDVYGRNRAHETGHSAQDIRIPFGIPPPVVGGPPFPQAFASSSVRQGGHLNFDPASMTQSGITVPNSADHRVPTPHFGLGGSHFVQHPDNRVHGLSPETIIQLGRIPPPSYVPMPPMTAMMGYRGQLPMQPNFLPVPQMPMNPFLQSPGGNLYHSQAAHFNPALSRVQASGNPFPVNPSVANSPDHGGTSYPVRPIPLSNLEVRASNGGTTSRQPKEGSHKGKPKPRISSDSDPDVVTNGLNDDIGSARNKKQPAKKQQTKKTPDPSVIEVDEIPCDDEEDGVDYVSRLNQIPQKKKFFALLNPRFEQVHVRGGGAGWRCKMIARLLNKSPQEVIETITIGRNKSRAKKAAAKEMLSSLESRVPELFSSETNVKQNVQAIRSQSALNAINQLVREGHLLSQPNCETEEVSDRDEDRWRCCATLVTKDHGRKVFSEYGSSKNVAKQKWARKALELLIELKSPGAEQFRCIIEPGQAPIKKTLASVPKASEVIVRASDDEISNASCDDIVDDMDLSLELPSDYELVVAKTELDCEKWFEAHAQPGTELGAFIDSKLARLSVDESITSEDGDESGKLKRPILCFSTATSCIVIRIDKRQACENESNLDLALDTFWIPEAVARVLEDPRVQKTALECDDGLDVLSEDHGIQCESVQDIAVSSLAIAGYGRVSDSQDLSSLRDLTKYWMRKEAKVISWEGIWPMKHTLVEERLGEDTEEVAIAVLSAYATFCVREKVGDAARLKRINTAGVANDLEVLSRRIVEVGAG